MLFFQVVLGLVRELKMSFKNVILRYIIFCKKKKKRNVNILEATCTLIGESLSGDINLVVIGCNTVSVIILLDIILHQKELVI